jgi:hypothetical protein
MNDYDLQDSEAASHHHPDDFNQSRNFNKQELEDFFGINQEEI